MKLKPCPFCGAAGETKKRKVHPGYRNVTAIYRAHCTNLEGNCIGVYISRYYDTEKEAADAWNWRDD